MKTSRAQFPLASALLICGVLMTFASSAAAWSYHSFAHGYTLSLPDDWVQVPEEVLAERTADLSRRQAHAGRFDVAFQPQRNQDIFEHPYILVEVIPYANWGYERQVNDYDIQQIVRNNTGMDPANLFIPQKQVMEGGGDTEPLDGALHFDHGNRRFTWDSSSTQSDGTRMRQWGFFGKDALVTITLHEHAPGSDRLRDMARAVAGSFKYEIGHEYQPAFTVSDAMAMGRQLFAAPNLGLVATLVCIGTAILFAAISYIAARRTPSYQQYPATQRERR